MISLGIHCIKEFFSFANSSNIIPFFQWWSYLLLSGMVFYPVGKRLFPFAFDKGYPFSKILGIFLPCWIIWYILSTGLDVSFFYFSYVTLFLLGILIWTLPEKKTTLAHKETSWKILLMEEVLFFVALLGWSCLRAFQPDIEGLEKYMDFGFVNAILQSSSMPPEDMWFAGEPVNYYYFGQMVCAYLIKATRVLPEYGYNLMIATLFGLTLLGALSMGSAMGVKMPGLRGNATSLQKKRRALVAGLIALVMITLGGNLHGFLFGELLPKLGKTRFFQSTVKERYWYPDATRYIGHNPETGDKTIHEFPIYSFVVADLHGHVSDIPVVMASTGILFSAFVQGPKANHFLLGGILLGISAMTNSWDFPIYLFLWAGALTCYFWKKGPFLSGVLKGIGTAIILTSIALIAAFPFLNHFQNFSQGVSLTSSSSPLWQLFVLWGDKVFIALCFFFFLAGLFLEKRKKARTGSRRSWWKSLYRGDLFAAGLFVAALGLMAVPEVLYVKDIYGTTYHRSNTMFKLGYQSFILFGAASAYAMVRMVSGTRGLARTVFYASVFLFILGAVLYYPFQAISSYYPLREKAQSLDGLRFLEKTKPGDYGAIMWLRKQAKGHPHILEAEGESYSGEGRISMATGLATPLGWYAHEWLWRNDQTKVQQRREEIETLYQKPLEEKASNLWKLYHIKYIILGSSEKKRYPRLDEKGLKTLGNVVYEGKDIVIIEKSIPEKGIKENP